MVWQKILKSLLLFGANRLYNHVDENNDNKIDKQEIVNFLDKLDDIFNQIRDMLD